VNNAAAEDQVPVEHVVSLLRERLYGAVSCLATLAVLAGYTTEDTNAWARMLDVAVALLAGVGVLALGIKIIAH
jgi:hypothetical protein